MKFLTNLALGRRISLLTVLGLVLGISVFSFLGMRAVNRATEVMLQDRMTTAHIVGGYLDEVLGRALMELKNTAEEVGDVEANDNLQRPVEALEETYNRLSFSTHSIYILDERGQIMWRKPESPKIVGDNLSLYPGMSQAIGESEASISGLVSEPLTNTPVILLTAPIGTDRGGQGTIIVAIDLAESSIGGFIHPIRLGETGYVEIVDQNGIVVARSEPGPELAPFEKSDHSGRFAALITAGEPTRGLCHTCHEPLQKVARKDVLAFVPLSVAQWGIVIRQSEEEALAPIRELRQNIILFSAGLFIIALFIMTVATSDVIRRIRMLTAASQRIADGDLVSPVTISKKDEVGILAQSLEDMRIKLKNYYGELEQLHQEVQRKDDIRGELLNEMFLIQEEERRRIARELHDETTQTLASLAANLEAAAGMLPNKADSKIKTILRKAQALSINTLDEMHKLIYELRPSLLDDLGLVAATRWLAENNLKAEGVTVNFNTIGRERRLTLKLETTLFRVIQEAVNNIARHARAKKVNINLYFRKQFIKVHITDDGVGFDVNEAISSKDRPRGLGLLGMQERVELVKGTLSIRSHRGGGTEIDIEIPYDKEVSSE